MLLLNTLKGNEGFSFSLRQGKPATVALLPALPEAAFQRRRVGPAIRLVHETRPRWQPAQLTLQKPGHCMPPWDGHGPPASELASGTRWGLRRRHQPGRLLQRRHQDQAKHSGSAGNLY